MSNFIKTKHGYTEDDHGYSGAFSWFPSPEVGFGIWCVIGHGQFAKTGFAVTDDFGTLVEMQA